MSFGWNKVHWMKLVHFLSIPLQILETFFVYLPSHHIYKVFNTGEHTTPLSYVYYVHYCLEQNPFLQSTITLVRMWHEESTPQAQNKVPCQYSKPWMIFFFRKARCRCKWDLFHPTLCGALDDIYDHTEYCI